MLLRQACFLIAVLVCATTHAGSVVVSLRAEVALSQPRFTLADIATLQCEQAADCRTLAGLSIGNAPRIDAQVRLTQPQLARLLRRLEPRLAQQFEWQGSDAVALTVATQSLPAAKVVDAAQAALASAYGDTGLTANSQYKETYIKLPVGAVSLNARMPDFPARDHTVVTVAVSIDNRFYRTIAVPMQLTLLAPVLIASRDLTTGSRFSCEYAQLRTTDIAKQAGLATQAVCSQTWRLRKPVAAGDAVTTAAIEPVPDVEQGSAVSLVADFGGIQLESRATALADGRIGEAIPVRPTLSTASIKARVVGIGQLQAIGR
ncbi:flagellar basal body P-ring formation chaperone FlgA [Chitinimonas sp. BJB300]|uniref:flagellar basal body P-ring formation chaperone FlgA n=1 Tax=Chitinimonas sp. BJB300 TaxID=1559339 RepID=UPI000C0D757D|nr:flagellar basal body P-ring formation chaperone FlgA [Chitinimonas sp. BJB300]PHV12879.1 flagella basal body P-ring formation protein FlgA [Chitinimonas sp. BJB300]TSJ86088.1 flagellar basal body P-ring formation protein FlgA [Chitinimonas sp. BJB300]